jgi:aspartate beta-hydroxylase
MDETLWLEGVRLWYNEQDYLGAIEIWETALNDLEWNDRCQPCYTSVKHDENHPLLPLDLLERPPPPGCERRVAQLLLFLAGCQLDAQRVDEARLSLIRCLRLSFDNLSENQTTTHLAFQEWLCSYEEEAHVHNDCDAALQMSKQIVDYSICKGFPYWTDPFQRPGFMYAVISGSKPHYVDHERPSWCEILEENWAKIREEFFVLATLQDDDTISSSHWPAVGSSDHRDGTGQHDYKVVDGDWRELVLFGSGAQPDLAPFTAHLIRKHIPDAITLAEGGGGEVIFSVLGKNTRIRAHCGSTNFRLTAHLGLSIPSSSAEECAIRVADTWYPWEEGKVLVFDDSFEHEVRNTTNRSRAVLLLRYWHPSLTHSQREDALSQAIQRKEMDTLRRFSPPLPSDCYKTVEDRSLELSRCSRCWRSGYSSVRVTSTVEGHFSCFCGCPITQNI